MVSFHLTIVAITKLFAVMGLGYLAVRTRLLRAPTLRVLSRSVIFVTLPCLVMDTYARVLEPDVVPALLLCFGAGIALITGSLLVAFVARRALSGPNDDNRGLFVSLSAMQNSGYLPIPLVAELLPDDLAPEGLLYTFMYIFVMSLVFWSYGIRLISGRTGEPLSAHIRRAVNPPMVSLVAGLVFLAPGVKTFYDNLVLLPPVISIVGQCTIPLVLLVLGGSLAEARIREGGTVDEIAATAVIKLVLIPACALIVLRLFSLGGVFGFALLLQACMPAATNHIVIVQEYGGNQALTSRALFVHYLGSLVSVPLFLGLS